MENQKQGIEIYRIIDGSLGKALLLGEMGMTYKKNVLFGDLVGTGREEMRSGKESHKIRNTPSSSRHSCFTIPTKEGVLELRNLVSLSRPSHLSVLLPIQKK